MNSPSLPTRLCRLIHMAAFFLAFSPAPLAASSHEPVEIDLLIIHTPAVTAHYSGAAGVEAHAFASVEGTNLALENSEIPVVFNLIGVEEVDYTESAVAVSRDLSRISGLGAGPRDEVLQEEVAALRDAYGADLVTLFRRGPIGGAAGIAFIINPGNPNVAAGFNVVSDEAALSNFVLAHELGHNLGAAHGRGETGNEPPLDFGHGHAFSAAGLPYRTIMSINSDHTRIPHFSNPNVIFQGTPTGVPSGDPAAADVASLFEISAPVIETFRIKQSNAPIFLSQPIGTTLVSGGTAQLEGLVRGFPPLAIQWYEGAIGDRSNPVPSDEEERERGGTETRAMVGPISGTSQFWIEAVNPNATTASAAIEAVVVLNPGGPPGELVAQGVFNTGLAVMGTPAWQEMTFSASYLHQLEIQVALQGKPSPVQVRFEEIDGPVLFEGTLPPDGISTWFTLTTVSFDIRQFVVPGRVHRLTLSPAGDEDSTNLFIWGGGEDTQDPEAGIGKSNSINPTTALIFSALGNPAWTYHTWVRDQEIPAPMARADASAVGDNTPNLLRYALGLDANAPASAIGPFAQKVAPADEAARFTYTRRLNAVDIALNAESSTDLIDWNPVARAQIDSLGPTSNDQETLEVSLPLNDDTGFIRLSIEQSGD